MHAAVIKGVVCSGAGHVSRLPPEKLEARRRVTGFKLVPGTLNVRVPDVKAAVATLGEPAHRMPGPARLGDLRMWPVTVAVGDVITPAFLVRHERSRTSYLELVADVHFRTEGAMDGTAVKVWSEH